MVLVAGLRSYSVGTDSGSYVRYFNIIRTFADVTANGQIMGEYGFWILTWLIHFISNQYMAFFLVIALIVVGCYQWVIVKHSARIEISLFVFITMGFYTFFFNGARQGIACAIFALAISPLLEKNFPKYLLYVLFAFLFHKTAIMLLPVYFFSSKANTFKNNMIIILIGCLAVIFMDKIVDVASQVDVRYAAAAARGQGEGGGYFVSGFIFLLGIFFLMFKKSIHIDRVKYDLFLNLFIFGLMIGVASSVVSANPSGILRYTIYFNVVAVFLWPIVFINLTDRLSKFLVGYIFILGYLIYFALTTERFSNLIPYTLNRSFLF